MSKAAQILATGLVILLLAGCQDTKTKDAHLLVDPEQAQAQVEGGFFIPEPGEADLVEQAAATRGAYKVALDSLVEYYEQIGNAEKLKWARNELRSFEQMAHYNYLMPGELLPKNLTPMASIQEADDLYSEAIELFHKSGGLVIIKDDQLLRQSLRSFNKLISQYPTSNKIDKAAYHAGKIYEHFKDYQLAVVYYQRAFQWNDEIGYPARFRAARVMDFRLRMRDDAVALYRLSIDKESKFENNVKHAKIRIDALTTLRGMPMEEEQPPAQENVEE